MLSTDALKVFDINLRQHFYSKELIESFVETMQRIENKRR